MKINQRYIKVFVLYLISILISNLFIRNNNLLKTILQTTTGYTVFALGLKYLKKYKK
ncbi:hypothetical protein NGH84_12675 [Staphylococcus saprophyticus]|uniref:hypothetical protein n=1 Tax=Staphylococcus TaxID=1279 RepID=UPI001472D5F2|nr:MULTISPECIES: hypothetical protein [Staphylococcus]MEB7999102.1 hypothetical protein [Staphylococcus saprophyticus]